MKEAHEVTLINVTVSFMDQPVDLVIGVELQASFPIGDGSDHDYTDFDWQVIYCRVLVDTRWYFLPETLYDEIDTVFGDQVGDKLWELTARM